MNNLNNILFKEGDFSKTPIWIMRQAGRYLPEYRQIREKAGSFLDLCYNPKMASEVTLQPLRRFDLDAAIIFSDILVIPDALGIKVDFVKGEGPKLNPLSNIEQLKALKTDNIINHLNPVFEAVSLTRSELPSEKSLIGFSGSPWTLATYICEGKGSKTYEQTKSLAIGNEEFFSPLIDILVESIITYLCAKIEAGVNVIKLFDSWAGVLSKEQYKKWVIEPNKKIVAALRKQHPNIPIICFPRGSGTFYQEFVKEVQPNAVAIDQGCCTKWAKEELCQNLGVAVQGNLDNYLLAYGSKDQIKNEVLSILEEFKNQPHIFNLGHGILPNTPVENMEFVVDLVKGKDKY